MPKTILFLGATGGVGLSALRRSLAAGHTCIALCRNPSKLSSLLPPSEASAPNLVLEKGNAHDIDGLLRVLTHPENPSSLVDMVISSIGGVYSFFRLTIDDPHVCETGMTALLSALQTLRGRGAAGSPRIVAVSSAGIGNSRTRDIPLLLVPLYTFLLGVPGRDKKAMEAVLVGSEELWTVVKASLLTDGPESEYPTRVGVEDPVAGTVESQAVGYTIGREDTGKWIFENLIQEERWVRMTVSITY